MIPSHLIGQWSSSNSKSPEQVSPGSVYKATWECPEHPAHVWVARVDSRVAGSGCPFCSGRRPTPGVNDLATIHPHLAEQWHPDNPVKPSEVSEQSNKRYLWLCPVHAGHVWEQRVSTRVAAPGCPFCSGQRVAVGFNDLATTHPELAKEWSPANSYAITDVSRGHDKPVEWVCSSGHCWKAPVYSRVKGGGCPTCAGQVLQPGVNDLETRYPSVAVRWSNRNDDSPSEVFAHSGMKRWWVCDLGHEWEAAIDHRVNGTGCPRCRQSEGEKQLGVYLRGLGLQPVVSDRSVVTGYELDYYFPELKVAVEYNGVYWHSEAAGRGRTYHQEKLNACKAQGIQLIQIWEDDWRDKRPIVEKMLAHKLGCSRQPKISARSTTVDLKVPLREAQVFLTSNHIQGWTRSTDYIGLRYKGEVVALICFKRRGRGTDRELVRYATSHIVRGGFTKLLRSADLLYGPGVKMVTFADESISQGGLYTGSGWVEDGILPPDYQYLYRKSRHHKFGFRLKRFREDSSLRYEPTFTERELADLNNLHRVWDSGKIRYTRYTV